jgi:superfamily I DNA/RNA helicase/RecB family exonuclease
MTEATIPPQLDPEQQRAADLVKGTIKLMGGAGAGKTTALVERAARLVDQGAEPEGILFFVQDRRQAIDLRDRLVRRLRRSLAGPSVFTFHAFAWSLLTRGFRLEGPDGVESDFGYRLAGLGGEPVLLPAFDQRAFVADLLSHEDPANWPVNGSMLGSTAFAGQVRDFMLRAQERLLTPENLRALAAKRGRHDWDELATFYGRYIEALEDPKAFQDGRPRVDFAGVLIHARRLIGEHPIVGEDLKKMYPHLLVDDFEEANRAEEALLEALLPSDLEERSAVVAGDPGGTVFGFRGADSTCLVGLDAEEVGLTHAYRTSTEPEILLYSHITEEARGVVSELRSAWSEGTSWGDMAVIVRDYRNLLGPLRRELGRAGVPVHVDGEALQLASDPVVRPVIDLFSIACRTTGYEQLWPGLLTSDLGGLGAHEMTQVRRAARLADLGVADLCKSLSSLEELPEPLRAKLENVCKLLASAARWAEELSPDECFWQLWRNSKWFAELVKLEDSRRLDSLTTLADALARFTDRRGRGARMREFIDTLVSAEFAPESVRLNRSVDAVTITTAHGAKGREFAFAVVAGCVERMWPDPARRWLLLDGDLLDAPKDYGERRKAALAEEHKLFKLAISRAPRVLLTGQRAGGSERTAVEPSRFLSLVTEDLPTENASVRELVLTPREAELAWRMTLSDTAAPVAKRLGALWGVSRLPDVDPGRWWWARSWTQNDIPIVGDHKNTSYSRFSDYENCPLQYLMGQVLGLDPDTSYQMNYGRLVHGIYEDLEQGRIPPEIDAAMDEAMRRWRDEEYPAGAVANYLKRNLREIVARFIDTELTNGHQMIATEEGFRFEINGWIVRGKIDRIDRVGRDGLRLVDYKTGGYKRDSEAQEDLQLWTYVLASYRDDHLKTLGVPKQAELLFPNYGKRSIARGVCVVRDAEDGTSFEQQVRERIGVVLQGIEDEEFRPSPKADCRFCKFKPICPMWPEGQELEVRA